MPGLARPPAFKASDGACPLRPQLPPPGPVPQVSCRPTEGLPRRCTACVSGGREGASVGAEGRAVEASGPGFWASEAGRGLLGHAVEQARPSPWPGLFLRREGGSQEGAATSALGPTGTSLPPGAKKGAGSWTPGRATQPPSGPKPRAPGAQPPTHFQPQGGEVRGPVLGVGGGRAGAGGPGAQPWLAERGLLSPGQGRGGEAEGVDTTVPGGQAGPPHCRAQHCSDGSVCVHGRTRVPTLTGPAPPLVAGLGHAGLGGSPPLRAPTLPGPPCARHGASSWDTAQQAPPPIQRQGTGPQAREGHPCGMPGGPDTGCQRATLRTQKQPDAHRERACLPERPVQRA